MRAAITQILAALVGIYTMGILVKAPKRTMLPSGLIGAAAWLLYLTTHNRWGESVSVFICALVVSFGAQIFARILKTPVTTILIPGFYPLVPGVTLYRCIYSLINQQLPEFWHYFQLTILTAGMIALGIFAVDSVMSVIYKIYNKHKYKRRIN